MIAQAREAFNRSFSEEKYQKLIQEIELEFPNQLDFRVAESPIFVDTDLKIKLLSVCNTIIDEIKKPDFVEKTNRAIPSHHLVPNENPNPDFLAIDFAITKNENGEFEPQLIELQGFPSLFAYQSYLASKYKKHFEIDNGYSSFFNRINTASYSAEMQNFLHAGESSEHTVLLEIFPEKQKTRLDFALTEKLWGVNPVCITKIKRAGKVLYYEKGGKKIEIRRLYNRLIFDDLERNFKDLKFDFDFNSEIEAQWLSHPNWFYRVSKFSLPLFQSTYIPQSQYLSELKSLPHDLENYVLKPLFSFAGAGVKIDLKPHDFDGIVRPEDYLLQQKIAYSPCIKDTRGEAIKTEIRMLYIWPEGAERPKLMTNLARLSRGEMIGVDFNKNFDWVGGSVAFVETK
jgi:hypothetical protein